MKKTSILSWVLGIFVGIPGSGQNVSILMQHGDQRGTGWNSREVKLTTNNVNTASFGKLFAQPVDDQVYAQPLIVTGLTVNGQKRNVLFVATTNNTVYAFDADSVNGSNFLWKSNFTPPGQRPPTNKDMSSMGACGGNYNDFCHADGSPANIGIVGTPIIDTSTKTMYFVSRNTNDTVFQQFIHAIDITTGFDKPGSPVQITPSVAGTGDGSSGGILPFDPARENQRGGLVLLNGIVYIPFAGHCDNPPFHGWVLGYDAASLILKIVFNDTPDGYGAGIWMSAAAPTVDENGNIYLTTGNGAVDTTGGNRMRGESLLKLTPNLATGKLDQVSFFTPMDWPVLEGADLDFGVTEVLLIPNTTQAFAAAKDGNMYLTNRDNMGGFSSTANHVTQTISLGRGMMFHSSFAYYKNPTTEYIYAWSENAALRAFPYNRTTGLLDTVGVVISGIQGPNVAANGTFMSVSSNGTQNGTGILWASHAATGDANQAVRPGILRAIDANNVTRELWNSNMKSTDSLKTYAKFVCPVIANGKVYMPTFSNQVVVFGLTDTSGRGNCNATVNVALNKNAVASSVENTSLLPSNAVDGNLSTRWASAKGTDPQWIYVDLGARYSVCRVVLNWEIALGRDFQIQASDDTVNWTTLASITGNTSYNDTIFVSGMGRYFRMYGTARGTIGGYSLYEFAVYGTPANPCPTPSNLSVSNLTRNGAILHWNAVTGVPSYNVQYKTVGASGYISATSNTNSLNLATLACGTDYLFRVQAACSAPSLSDYSPTTGFSTSACDPACGALPTRWAQQDIGQIGISGQACYNNNIWNIQASGSDIWGNRDQFHFAYKTFTGDGQVTARVDTIDKTSTWNKAGVMFRDSLTQGSRCALIAFTSGNGMTFQYRSMNGGLSSNTNVTGFILPYYIKLVKRGTKYSGYVSQDSITWTQIGQTVDLGFGAGTACYAGLATCAHNNTILSESRFDKVPIIFSSDTSVKTSNGAVVTVGPHPTGFPGPGIISLYPNPSSDRVTIESSAELLTGAAIWNLSGAIVKKVQASGSRSLIVDISSLSAGVYTVTIQTQRNVVVRKLVKMGD